MWDSTNLYFLATVTDSALVNGSPDWNGDAVEIYIDGDNNKATKYDSNDFQYVLGYGHTAISEYAHSATTNVKFAQTNITGGYQMEFAMPWATLTVTPTNNMQIGLDAAIDDATSASGGRTSQLFWHDSSGSDYSNPSLFGIGVLTPASSNNPPATPTGLTATATSATCTTSASIALSWTASSGATSYNVYRATSAGGEGTTAYKTGVTTTTYTDSSVSNATTYYYTVQAVNSYGSSSQSTEANAATGAAPTVPGTPGTPTVTNGDTQVTLSWTAASGTVTSYNLYRSTTSGGEGTTAYKTGITTTSYTDTGLTDGSTYYYKVAAVNGCGTGTQSGEATGKPVCTLPGAPSAPTASAGNAQVALSWSSVSGATAYNVYRSTASGGEGTTPINGSAITTTSYTDTGLTNGTTYYYKLAAMNSCGTGSQSGETSAT